MDHLEPVTEHPERTWSLEHVRPAHGAPGNPCPVCSAAAGRKIHCNQLRGMGSVERARRIIAEMTEKGPAAVTTQDVRHRITGKPGGQQQDARPQARPKPDPEAGRAW